MQGFLRTPWNATSHSTAQDALWQHILDRNTSSQPFMTPCARQVINRIAGNVTPLMSRVLRAAPLMLNERSNILTSTEKLTTSKASPPDRGPHCTQARQPRVPGDICLQYGIISTLKIPAVSSGAMWTLSLRNFVWTCITLSLRNFLWTCIAQVQSTFTTDHRSMARSFFGGFKVTQ